MKVRDDQRFKDGQLRFVQGLLQSYINERRFGVSESTKVLVDAEALTSN